MESGFGSAPDPQVDSKGRLDPTWDRFGNIFKEFLVNFVQNYVSFTLFHKDSSVQGASAGNAKRKQFVDVEYAKRLKTNRF